MNINALMKQAQKMQSDMTKAQRELEKTLFEFDSAGGAIHLSIYGNRKIEKIEIDRDAIDPDDKEMLEDMIKLAINEAIERIDEENEKIQAKLTSGMRMPF
ncbi:MAG: YbaB/EbfC family nucleoid-associated protein [Erysipelotrichaceae bacterium]|jgi:DNA-binding YbaB/EbfC family protein|nr:YbaB/EbfC family nucleoid-associated protein [Erysipelotrichaceae bacterium]